MLRKSFSALMLLVVLELICLAPAAVAQNPACETGHTLRYSKSDHSWITQTWEYNVIVNSFPEQASTDARRRAYLNRIRDAVTVWNTRRNYCGYDPFYGFRTSRKGTGGSTSTDRSDKTSTIDFGNRPCGRTVDGCHDTQIQPGVPYETQAGRRFRAIESDIRLDRQSYHYRLKTIPCQPGGVDLLTLAAHEIGHAAGLGDTYDEGGGKNSVEIMGWNTERCDFNNRRAGRADSIGLRRLYTFR